MAVAEMESVTVWFRGVSPRAPNYPATQFRLYFVGGHFLKQMEDGCNFWGLDAREEAGGSDRAVCSDSIISFAQQLLMRLCHRKFI